MGLFWRGSGWVVSVLVDLGLGGGTYLGGSPLGFCGMVRWLVVLLLCWWCLNWW